MVFPSGRKTASGLQASCSNQPKWMLKLNANRSMSRNRLLVHSTKWNALSEGKLR